MPGFTHNPAVVVTLTSLILQGLTPFGVASKLVCVELCGFDLRCILLIHAFVIAINVGGSMTNDYP